MSIEAQLQRLEVRRSLEELAVRLATARAEPGQRDQMLALAAILDAFHGEDVRAFALLLRASHGLVARAAHNDFLSVAMAPLQGLSRRFRYADLRVVAADLHSAIQREMAAGDTEAAAAASLRLNDYLWEVTHQTLRTPPQ